MEQSTQILPQFPLSVFLFPGEDIPLRIFEPRYKQLIADIRQNKGSFVIPFIFEQKVQEYGCEVFLKNVVAENPGGSMVITVEALSLVRILDSQKQMDGKLYAGGLVERFDGAEPIESQELKMLIIDYAEDFDQDFLSCCKHRDFTREDVMKALNLPSEDKFRFVCISGGQQKEIYLAGQLRYLRMLRRQESLLNNDFGLN